MTRRGSAVCFILGTGDASSFREFRNCPSVSRQAAISIGLLWHSASAGNLGVGALTVGNLLAARQAADACGLRPKFTILEFAGDFGGTYVHEADVVTFEIHGRSLISPQGYWATISKLDCILDIGAGDSFADIYGLKRFLYLWVTKELAYLRGTPLLLSPQTIGPFTRQPFRALAAHAMRRARAVVARDPASFAAIGDISPRARAVQAVDVAFLLPFEAPSPKKPGILDIGINVSGLLFNGGYSSGNDFGLEVDYAQLTRDLIAELVGRPGVRVHLISHVNSDRIPKDDDRRVADLLAEAFPGAIRVPDFASPSEAKSYIAGLDFLVAGRMHACIAAYSAGVPVVPIAYSRKFSGLFRGVLNYPYEVPVRGLTTQAALDYILQCLEDRAQMRAEITRGMTVVAAALSTYDDELQRLFREVA